MAPLMPAPTGRRRRALLGAAPLAGLAVFALSHGPQAPEVASLETAESRRYHPDPAHPWNRLHAALAGRLTAGGRTIGLDQPDLLLWADSSHLLEPQRQAELLAALQAFSAAEKTEWIEAALPRALMQHDLWAVFDWAVAERVGLTADAHERRAAIARALVPALARVALPSSALETLADPLAATVKSWAGAREADPRHPQAPFLPDVEWVRLGDLRGEPEPLAVAHANVLGGRSVLEVRLFAPGGPSAATAWLAELREGGNGTVACGGRADCFADERTGALHLHLDPALPAPPVGSVVALVRRMLAFDDTGELHATPLVKSVQLRAFLEAPPGATGLALGERPQGWPWQAVGEWVLEPERLLAGEAAALRPVRLGEHAFRFLGAHGDEVATLPEDFDTPGRTGHLDSCSACHGIAGTLSINSYSGLATGPGTQLLIPLRRLPRRLGPVPVGAVDERAIAFKRGRFDWGALWAGLSAHRATAR